MRVILTVEQIGELAANRTLGDARAAIDDLGLPFELPLEGWEELLGGRQAITIPLRSCAITTMESEIALGISREVDGGEVIWIDNVIVTPSEEADPADWHTAMRDHLASKFELTSPPGDHATEAFSAELVGYLLLPATDGQSPSLIVHRRSGLTRG